MNGELRKLRALIRRSPVNGRGYRQVSPAIRERVLAIAPRNARREDYIALAAQLDINVHTMLGWRERTRKQARGRKLRAVVTETRAIHDVAEPQAISAVGIEGLSVASAVELARALS